LRKKGREGGRDGGKEGGREGGPRTVHSNLEEGVEHEADGDELVCLGRARRSLHEVGFGGLGREGGREGGREERND